MEKYTFFWGGLFSQWADSKIMIDGVEYNCCEQYMMAQKALLFKDMEMYQEIMNEQYPAIQKSLGRKVKDFDSEKWNAIAKHVVYRANTAKFTQNKNFFDALMATGDTLLVEASPEDTIWGIGLSENDPRALDKTQWLGTNWLGQIITDVRMDILNEKEMWNIFLENPLLV
jgi:ribA/ribD-fused uncharacterized protein